MMRTQPAHGRYEHSAITSRPHFKWPGGKRLAVYFALGVEHYAFGEGMTENLAPGMAYPDVLNTSWREYGNRVGAWRILQAFEGLRLPLSILLNSAVCEHAPDLIEAARVAQCEFIAHGYSNSDTLAGMSEDAESPVCGRRGGADRGPRPAPARWVGRARGSPRHCTRRTSWVSRDTDTCSTGAWTISRYG